MDKIIKVFDILFGMQIESFSQSLALKITAISQAIILFFAGFIYGDAPIDMKITCEIPSAVYEYEVGDIIDVFVKVENVGRPFKSEEYIKSENLIDIYIYHIDNGNKTYLYTDEPFIHTDEMGNKIFANNGYTIEQNYHIIVKENLPKGDYVIKVRSGFGFEEIFEGLITIK